MYSAREVIDIAIRLEKNAEDFYRNSLEEVSNPALESALRFLADQEHQHRQWFERLKESVQVSAVDPELEEMSGAMLQGLVEGQMFSLGEADISEVERVGSLIDLAVEHETDAIMFYELLQSLIDSPEDSEVLSTIIAEENRHIEILQECAEGESGNLLKRSS
jgi:rubrerythrin